MALQDWLDSSGSRLSTDFPLPLDEPFTPAIAKANGISDRQLRLLHAEGHIRPILRGVHVPSQADDSISLRCRALGLVLSEDAVVTDRTAGWLHGMPVLKRGSHLKAPPIEVCHPRDTRTERPSLDGHRRQLRDDDVTVLDGIRVTTPLRTSLDLGRLLWRFDALSALDAGLRLGVSHDDILEEVERFKGFRGVRQLRSLAPLADPRAESPPESALRLHWYDAGLPAPDLQIWVAIDGVALFRLDLGDEESGYAAEYDGVEFHTSPADVAHDRERRRVLEDECDWTVDVFTNDDVYGRNTTIESRLKAGLRRARRTTRWNP